MTNFINLLKLCVGAEKVEDLMTWQAARYASGQPAHVTRMWPKREDEILAGGSLYWVFKGQILARQRIVDLRERIGEDGIRRCALVFDPEIIRTEPAPRRAFQGWRYLRPEDAPRDLPQARGTETALPNDLANALAQIGLR